MSKQPIQLAFVWHQHQPYYFDASGRKMLMPWVRLHGIKDYYDMPAKLKDYPKIKQTFNLVPSLLKQLKAYENGDVTDEYLELSEKAAKYLDESDRVQILERFFDCNRNWMVEPFDRYRDLLHRRESVPLTEAVKLFQPQDFLDLQVWFNLTWFDPVFKEGDELIQGLIKKGQGFSEEEKMQVLEKQRQVIAQVIPIHKEMAEAGQIELTTTPFYHPILPLLCDTEIARVALPHDPMPEPFQHPEDAKRQIEKGLEYFESHFGFRPQGMWPSEGSVSDEALSLVAGAGIRWAATDEAVLSRSLNQGLSRTPGGEVVQPEVLYQPYRLKTKGGEIDMIFRDHVLSDLIGFHYSNSPAEEAAEDFIRRVRKVGENWKNKKRPPLVSVILDGENCWETYPRDGHDFLDALYSRLTEVEDIQCTTVKEYLEEYPADRELNQIYPGSWINHNFRIWIGHPEDNKSWDLLNEARRNLVGAEKSGQIPEERIEKAWEELYIAQGSDWNWWYGDDHTSGQDHLFDQLYRRRLMNIYELIGQEIPVEVLEAIGGASTKVEAKMPTRFIHPKIDGRVTHYYEWEGAGFYDAVGRAGAMHQVSRFMTRLYFGFDLRSFYLHLEFESPAAQLLESGHRFEITISQPERYLIRIDQTDSYELLRWEKEEWQPENRFTTVAVDRIVECSAPWESIEVKPKASVQFLVRLLQEEMVLETAPGQSMISFQAPDKDFESRMWMV